MSGFDESRPVRVCALHLGQSIRLSAVQPDALGTSLVVPVEDQGLAILFRHGSMVLFGLEAAAEARFAERLRPHVLEPVPPVAEEIWMIAQPEGAERTHENLISLVDFSSERLHVLATVLAKSVALAHYEYEVAAAFDQVEPFASNLERKGRVGSNARELLRHIGRALRVLTRTIAYARVADKPDVLWDHPELERLHDRLVEEYEIAERHAVLERKINLISQTAGTVLDLLNTARSLRVEWYIVLLIVFEICLSLPSYLAGL